MCRRDTQTTYHFKTRNFAVVAEIEYDPHVDISFDDTNETRDNLASGKWTAFQTTVTVY